MKATGIIRRIDELGRIVVPKEIRKNLRIKEGESLEIFLDDENIVLKKYSSAKKISDLAQNFTDAIYYFIKHNIIISDNNVILAASGNMKKEYLNKPISIQLENKINKREDLIEKNSKNISIVDEKEINATYAISPIIVNGDTVGTVMIFSTDKEITEIDYKLVQIVSKFLSSHLE
jgi:AbrB family transcriptional regulator (stage V sporulation protein T)